MQLLKVGKAVSARALFTAHSLVAVSRAAKTEDDPWYWVLSALLLLLLAEGVLNIAYREANETVGFCPCVFLYLCSVVPAIWLMEIRLAADGAGEEELAEGLGLSALWASEEPGGGRRLYAQVLEQLLLVVLVVGRWLLPKGDLSRDQLSQLLLVYVGTAADIAELLETFKEPEVEGDEHILFAILGIWSWSLLQFTIVLPNSAPRRRRMGLNRGTSLEGEAERGGPEDANTRLGWWGWLWRNMDLWGILLSTFLQDGPFLAIRLYLILARSVLSYMMIFFTAKNTLVLLLQLYRLAVLVQQHRAILRKRAAPASAKGPPTLAPPSLPPPAPASPRLQRPAKKPRVKSGISYASLRSSVWV